MDVDPVNANLHHNVRGDGGRDSTTVVWGRMQTKGVEASNVPATMDADSIAATAHPNARGDSGTEPIVARKPLGGLWLLTHETLAFLIIRSHFSVPRNETNKGYEQTGGPAELSTHQPRQLYRAVPVSYRSLPAPCVHLAFHQGRVDC